MASQLVPCFHITVVLLCFTVGRSDISCRNEAGEAVDWWVDVTFFRILLLCCGHWYWGTKGWIRWSPIFSSSMFRSVFSRFIIYKLPKFRIGEVGSGVEYMYLDSAAGSWQRSKFMVNTTQGAMANTLNQLYKGKVYMVRSDALLHWRVLLIFKVDP